MDVDRVPALVVGVSGATRALINLRLSWARGEKIRDWSFFWTVSKTNSSCCSNVDSGSEESRDEVVAGEDLTGWWGDWEEFSREQEIVVSAVPPSVFWTAAPEKGGKKKSIWVGWSEAFIIRGGSFESWPLAGNLKTFDPRCTKQIFKKNYFRLGQKILPWHLRTSFLTRVGITIFHLH